MKDATPYELSQDRPNESARNCINHCLSCLFTDKTKLCEDLVVHNLSYEELIGTLLAARDVCEDHARLIQEQSESQ